MKGKKGVFWGAIVALMLLPAIGIAESWADFVGTIDAATKKAEGEVVVTAPATVDPPVANDKVLYVPKGVELVIKGGRFEYMWLGGGNITLQGVSIDAGDRMAAIMLMPNGTKAVDIALTLAEDTTLHCDGTFGAATIQWMQRDNRKVGNLTLVIDNRGTITAQNTGIDVSTYASKTVKTDVTLRNSGTISGFKGFKFAFANPGQIVLQVVNEGTINATSDGRTGITFSQKTPAGIEVFCESSSKKTAVIIENTAAGTITVDGDNSSGIGIAMGQAYMKKKAQGQGQVVNDGVVTGGQTGIEVVLAYEAALPVQLSGGGTTRGGEPAPGSKAADISVQLYSTSSKTKINQEAFEGIAEPWLDANIAMEELPAGTFVMAQIWEDDEMAGLVSRAK